MKYHITIGNIITALLILFLIVGLLAATTVHKKIDKAVTKLVSQSLVNGQGDNNYILKIDSIDKKLFSYIKLNNVVLQTSDNYVVASLDHLIINSAAYRFLHSSLYPKNIKLSIKNLDFKFNDDSALLSSLLANNETSTQNKFKKIEVELKDSNIYYNSKEFLIDAQNLNLGVSFSSNVINYLSLTSNKLFIDYQKKYLLQTDLLNVELKENLDEQTIKGHYAKLLFFAVDEDIKVESSESALQIKTEDILKLKNTEGELSLKSDLIVANYDTFAVSLNEFETTTLIQDLKFVDSKFSFNKALANYDLFTIESGKLRTYLKGGLNKFSTLLEIEDSISLYKEYHPLASIDKSSFNLSFDEKIEQLVLISEGFSFLNIDKVIELNEIENGQLRDIKAKIDFTKDILVSGSFDFSSRTNLPIIEEVTSDIDFQLTLNEDFKLIRGELAISNLIGNKIFGPINTKIDFDQNELKLNANHLDSLIADLKYNFSNKKIVSNINFFDYSLELLKQHLEVVNFQFADFVNEESTIDGSINYSGDSTFINGVVDLDLELSNIEIEKNHFNFAAGLKGSFDSKTYFIDKLLLSGVGFEISFKGLMDRKELIPEGNIVVRNISSEQTILEGSFKRDIDQLYQYTINSNLFGKTVLDGQLSWSEERILHSQGFLQLPTITYPVTLFIDTYNLLAKLDVENLELIVDLLSEPTHASMIMIAEDFKLPKLQLDLLSENATVSGVVEADFSLTDNLFLVESSLFKIDKLIWPNGNQWSLDLDFVADPYQIRINNLTYLDQFGSYKGSLSLANNKLVNLIDAQLNNFTFSLDFSGEDDSFIKAYLYTEEDNLELAKGVILVEQLNSSRFINNLEEKINLTIVGQTDLTTNTNINLELIAQNALLKGAIENEALIFEEAFLKSGPLSIHLNNSKLNFDGDLDLEGIFKLESDISWRDATSLIPFKIKSKLEQSKTINQLFSNIKNLGNEIPLTTIIFEDSTVFGLISWPSTSHSLSLKNNLLEVRPLVNGAINLNYNLSSGHLNLIANDNFILPLRAKGIVNSENIALELADIKLEMKDLNAFFVEPIIDFKSGVMRGNGWIEGPFKDPEYWATFSGSSVELTTFWTVGELISIKNPTVTVSENSVTINPSYISVVHESGRSTNAMAKLEATLEKWSISHYRLDIFNLENPISFWLPLFLIDLNIEAKVIGPFAVEGTADEETLYGDITVSDAKISFGIPNLPSWVKEKRRTSIDMTIRTGRNNSFVYPNEDSPMLRATLADEQSAQLKVIAPSMATTVSGELALRSGEIYYVQKNFYITEGSIKFPSLGSILDADLFGLLSLRARLREFDVEGNRIDIYLVLQDSQFDSINPRFESIPSLSTNEILELLGQSIVSPGGFGDSALHSVVSVATAATDVISRLGLLQATTISIGFTNVIREALGLDVFTIRTNLLQNILFEALPSLDYDSYVSPLARYLDNTTVYIGKYLTNNFYLQGMLHFREDSSFKGSSFLANDLRVDTELSVEWTNPLATFSFFTQPEELSVFEFFDTMGFSITKRIEF